MTRGRRRGAHEGAGLDLVLVHGAYHGAWCWDLLVPELEGLGHVVTAVDLPVSDPDFGAAEYAAIVNRAVPRATEPVLVGHSMAGLVIPLVASRRPVRRLVFLAALLPSPGRSAAEQRAEDTVDGHVQLRTAEFLDLGDDVWAIGPNTARELFYHDVSDDLVDWATARLRPQAYRFMNEPTPLEEWPDVPVDYIVCRDDRATSPDWGRRVARDRLGVEAVEIDGGHSPFLARPAELARAIDRLVR